MPVLVPSNFEEIAFTPDSDDMVLSVDLDSIPYRLDLHWSNRSQYWYLSVYTAQGTLISGPKKIRPLTTISSNRKTTQSPPGAFYCWVFQDYTTPPTRYDFGAGLRCRLYYGSTT